MRKGLLLAAVLAALALVWPAAALADEKVLVSTVEDMAAEVIALFPRAEGRVTSAEGGAVSLDIGSGAGLKPGMEVFLFREGRPIIHPVTKAVLGSTEEKLGSAVLTGVEDGFSEGRIDSLLVTRIVPGDTARLSTEPVALRVRVEGSGYDAVLFDRLLRELRASNRFEISVPEQTGGDGAPDEKEGAGTEAGRAAYVLGFSTSPSPEERKMVAGLTLVSAGGDRLLDIARSVDATPEVYDETLMDYPLVRGDYRDFYIIEELPFRGRHMAVGNVAGDSGKEVVVSDGQGIAVYRFEGRILREVWREEPYIKNNHLSVECADMNGNGLDEIYVTNFDGDALSSYVVEYTEGGFKRICAPVGLFFRVLDVPGRGRMLITTTKGSASPYSGIIYEYSWNDGALVKGEKVNLPDRIKDPYGFVLVDLVSEKKKDEGGDDDGKGPFDGLEVVWVDDSDYLQVLDMDGKRLWKSGEHYGGYDNYFELDKRSLALPTVDPRGKVKGRLIVREDEAGRKTVVLTRNVPMTYVTERFKGYSNADIFALFWNGTEMEADWSIRNIDGYIADIYMGEVAGQGRDEILVLVEPTMKILKKSKSLPLGSVGSVGNVTADRSSLLVYKVPMR